VSAGTKHFHHHVVADLELAYESADMIPEPGLTLTVYAAEPSAPTAHALDLLASWTAIQSDRPTRPRRHLTANPRRVGFSPAPAEHHFRACLYKRP